MFCLRSWIPLLIFLTNASPIYIVLFLTATYAIQRPCVYCSILLFVLVFSLFDFQADWFESRWQPQSAAMKESLTPYINGNATLTDAILQTASAAVSAINGTGGSLAGHAIDAVRRRVGPGTVSVGAGGGLEALRGLLEKKQLRLYDIAETKGVVYAWEVLLLYIGIPGKL